MIGKDKVADHWEVEEEDVKCENCKHFITCVDVCYPYECVWWDTPLTTHESYCTFWDPKEVANEQR